LPGGALTIELTEDLFMADPERAGKVIKGLRDAGVAIAVDDYGTGYSSLAYLRELTGITALKIDRAFVTDLDRDPRAQAIVSSTVTLAESLGLKLVAEGVETEKVRDRLAHLGCSHAQGYLFGRPCQASAVEFGVLEAARARPSR
jgi:EAL domain-containing protein (putative c-di-GMP-specific phosphodiesterase class I)